MRSRHGRAPPSFSCRWVVEAGWLTSDLASPRLTNRLNSSTRLNMFDACRVATRRAESEYRRVATAEQLFGQFMLWIVVEPRPPYPRDALVFRSQRATAAAFAWCRSQRRESVSRPCNSRKALKGDSVAPSLRMPTVRQRMM